MSKNYRNTFPVFLYFFLTIERLGNRNMTPTVKIWNEVIILISIPFSLTFSWRFGEFQNFLTHMKIYWLFPDFLRLFTFSWLFPDLWEPWNMRLDNLKAIFFNQWRSSSVTPYGATTPPFKVIKYVERFPRCMHTYCWLMLCFVVVMWRVIRGFLEKFQIPIIGTITHTFKVIAMSHWGE